MPHYLVIYLNCRIDWLPLESVRQDTAPGSSEHVLPQTGCRFSIFDFLLPPFNAQRSLCAEMKTKLKWKFNIYTYQYGRVCECSSAMVAVMLQAQLNEKEARIACPCVAIVFVFHILYLVFCTKRITKYELHLPNKILKVWMPNMLLIIFSRKIQFPNSGF